jgi:molybdate transport system permease protein
MTELLAKVNWSPLYVTLRTGIISIIFVFILGLLAAALVMRMPRKVKWVIDAVLTMPLVLPPTVAGYLLLLLFSLRRPIGIFLDTNYGIRFVQTPLGCVLAASVIAFPLMYRSARGAFEQVDINLIHAGRTLGMSEFSIFSRVTVPTAAPGLISGGILAFARAIGEYGATSMLAGNVLGKTRTIAVAIASEVSAGNFDMAGFWTTVIVIIAFLIILSINLFTGFGMKRHIRW